MNHCGSTLLEVVLVTFLFGVIGTGFVATLITSSQTSKRGMEHIVASGYIKEGIEAARSIRDRDWGEMANGTHGLSTSSGYYDFTGSSDSLDNGAYTRTITIEDVYRLGSLTGDISASGTVLDTASKKITVNITWLGTDTQIKNLDAVFYVSNWGQQSWLQTLTADFVAGFQNSTGVTSVSNGEIQLAAHDTTWSQTQVQYAVNLVGSGDRQTAHYDEVGDVLYLLALNTAGDDFEAYDMSDVSENTPTKIGGYDIQNATDFVIAGGYGYISTTDNSIEVEIVDVSSMTRVASIDLAGSADADAIVLAGTTLVIGRESSGEDELWFYDVTDPLSPVFLRSTNVSASFNDLAASSTHVFGTSNNNNQEVYAFQISDGSEVGTLDMLSIDNALDLHLVGNNLYVARDDGSSYDLARVDVSAPSAMNVTASVELGESLNDVEIDQNEAFAYVATGNSSQEVIVVNLSTFAQEAILNATGSGSAKAVEVYGGYVYVSHSQDALDLMIMRVPPGGWDAPALIGWADKTQNHNARGVFVAGSYAYLVADNNNAHDDFFVYDISIPSNPTYLGSLDLASYVTDVVVSGNYAYVATSDNSAEMKVVDVTTKTSPVLFSTFNAAGNQNGLSVAITGSTLFLGREDSGNPELYAIDVSTPASPSILDTIEFSNDLTALAVQGNYLYAATHDNNKELVVFDISLPAAVVEVASYNASGSENGLSIDVSGSMLTLGRVDASSGELLVFDVSAPTSPTLTGTGFVDDDIFGLSLDGTGGVYLATGENNKEFMRWDISVPSSPVLDASLDLNADATDVQFSGSYAYLSSEHDSQELQVVGEGSPPNGYALEGTFTSQPFDAGSEVSWNAIAWTLSGTGDIAFRIRTADSQTNLANAAWVGSEGASSTSYTVSGSALTLDPSATGSRWIQWKAYLSGDGTLTPVLSDVTLYYSP